MDKKLKVATVGTGYFSQFHYDSWHRLAPTQMVGLCHRSSDAAGELAQRYAIPALFTDLEDMLDKTQPDILDIITPPETHSAFVRAAVDRGILAICQKPFTPSLAEAQDLVDYISRSPGEVVIHENFRFQPWYRHLNTLLQRRTLGDLYQVTFWLRPGDGQGPEAYLARQPYFQQMERFLIHETAIHFIDVFRYLFGEVSSLYAQLDRLNPVIAGEDAGLVIFNFAEGMRGVFDGNRLVDHAADNPRRTMGEMRIEGSLGTLTLNGQGEIHLRKQGVQQEVLMAYDWQDRNFGGDCVYHLNRHVVEHLTQGTALMNSAADYLTNLRIEDAIYQSSQDTRQVSL
ncbi:Gfo/Idh/MocA family protein [Rhodovibrionaceae bacterium A322]